VNCALLGGAKGEDRQQPSLRKAPFVLCGVFAKPRFGNTLDDPIATRAVSVGSFEFHSGILPDLHNDPVMCCHGSYVLAMYFKSQLHTL
ncbi:hypothetical protein Gotur_017900, partial [Gossypium turneri]